MYFQANKFSFQRVYKFGIKYHSKFPPNLALYKIYYFRLQISISYISIILLFYIIYFVDSGIAQNYLDIINIPIFLDLFKTFITKFSSPLILTPLNYTPSIVDIKFSD